MAEISQPSPSLGSKFGIIARRISLSIFFLGFLGVILWRCLYSIEMGPSSILVFILFPSALLMLFGATITGFIHGFNQTKEVKIATGCLFSVAYALLSYFFIAMLFPPVGSANERARRISCSSNLKQIGLALKQYAIDNDGCFPSGKGVESFESLRSAAYLTDYKIFVCPTAKILPASGNEPLTEKNLSYVYLGSGLKDSPENADKPLVCDKPDNHMKYGNVLFCDGHVMGFPGTKWLEGASQEKRSP